MVHFRNREVFVNKKETSIAVSREGDDDRWDRGWFRRKWSDILITEYIYHRVETRRTRYCEGRIWWWVKECVPFLT